MAFDASKLQGLLGSNAVLGLGLGLLSGGWRGAAPGFFSGARLDAYNREQAQEDDLRKMQLQQAQQKQQATQRAQQALLGPYVNNPWTNPDNPQAGPQMGGGLLDSSGLDPAHKAVATAEILSGNLSGLSGLLPKPAEPYTLTPGALRFDPNNKQVAAAPTAPPTGFTRGPDGSLQVDPAYRDFALQKAQAGKTTVNNSVNLGQNEFAKGLGSGLSKDFIAQRDTARDATLSLQANNEARKLLDSGVFTGFGANFKLGIGKALQQVGFHAADDPIANSEAFVATRAKEVGRIIKLFGSGTGLSDADREYAQKAAAGNIDMNAASMRKILDISDRASRNIVARYNADASKIDPNTVPFPLTIDAPPPYQPGSSNQSSAQPAGTVHQITNDADYDALPSGATFIGPDGKTRRKP